ncbi:hypothetical protein OEZ86_012516 [Tetradesmus obliquus]|nr:hypothetical protein OEZ86_012516 [Tetradesmus obliquus]
MSLRTRATSFLAGFALAGGATFYQLHTDINNGTEYLAAQAKEARQSLELRVAALEAAVGGLQPAAAAPAAAADAPAADEVVAIAEPVS